jgi:hypothetical protein
MRRLVFLYRARPRLPVGRDGWRHLSALATTRFFAAHGNRARRGAALLLRGPSGRRLQPLPEELHQVGAGSGGGRHHLRRQFRQDGVSTAPEIPQVRSIEPEKLQIASRTFINAVSVIISSDLFVEVCWNLWGQF